MSSQQCAKSSPCSLGFRQSSPPHRRRVGGRGRRGAVTARTAVMGAADLPCENHRVSRIRHPTARRATAWPDSTGTSAGLIWHVAFRRPRLLVLVATVCAVTGCASTVGPDVDAGRSVGHVEAGTPNDGAESDAPGLDTPRADVVGMDAVSRFVPPRYCPMLECAPGTICCYITGRCFSPVTERDSCRVDLPPPDAGVPPDSAGWSDGALGPAPPRTMTPHGRAVCASDADCGAGEYCSGGCLGYGECMSRPSCASCSPPGNWQCVVCGCNGRTYESPQAACAPGVRLAAGPGECGVGRVGPSFVTRPRPRIPCGNDGQCAEAAFCCPILGVCVDRNCPSCCRFVPQGTVFPCRDNADCSEGEYCGGAGCEWGGCMRVPSGGANCAGPVNPVCGCDGRSYDNTCFANSAGVRIAATGTCR